MNAKKESISLPEDQAEWIEQEMAKTRRKRSSIVQEAIELLMASRKEEETRDRKNGK